ncbi:hypothetical protein CO666_01685 [Rhizobium chutanense]|uniref:Uncharacterized protein n=1 Tax=Rhizobium chutanense TaxID=2035448 RepID=A0A2A6JIM5_9HYPH|nr:hypothetical protein CO666_01685 [Rhizobium chutanense]
MDTIGIIQVKRHAPLVLAIREPNGTIELPQSETPGERMHLRRQNCAMPSMMRRQMAKRKWTMNRLGPGSDGMRLERRLAPKQDLSTTHDERSMRSTPDA